LERPYSKGGSWGVKVGAGDGGIKSVAVRMKTKGEITTTRGVELWKGEVQTLCSGRKKIVVGGGGSFQKKLLSRIPHLWLFGARVKGGQCHLNWKRQLLSQTWGSGRSTEWT